MPTISVFFGIIIKMYREINSRHNLPHIHAEYQEYEAVISLDGEILNGELPSRKMKLVQAWIEIHQEDLQANWKLLSEGKEFFKIDPLR
jgi:hypothetical protein